MPKPMLNRSLLKKRIPTLLGLLVLVAGLVVGTILFSQGTGVFSPRATPETTPKLVKITNVTDRSFSVSFLTEESTTAFIKYGTEPNRLNLQAGDDRDQLYGTVKDYSIHHISASSLEQKTKYYFVIGTNNGALYDDDGKPFEVLTSVRGGTPPEAKTIFGSVTTPQGGPAAGSIVYAKLDEAGELSQLVQESGSWAIALSNARKQDGSGYASVSPNSNLILLAQGNPSSQTTTIKTTVSGFETGSNLVLGQSGGIASGTSPNPPNQGNTPPAASPSASPTVTVPPIASGSGITITPTPVLVSSESAGLLGKLLDENSTPTPTIVESKKVDLTLEGDQTVTTSQPEIVGTAPPGVVITIKVNSETQIEQQITASNTGEFALDLATLGAELEPGSHSVEYSYIDPATGQVVTETQTFTVADTSVQIAQATSPTSIPTNSPTPVSYGTDYPYGTSPTPTTNYGSDYDVTATLSPTPTTSYQDLDEQTSMPSTESGMPVSGAVETTLVLIFGGLFFIISGAWSFWIAKEMDTKE